MLIRTHSEAVLLLVICYFCYFATCYFANLRFLKRLAGNSHDSSDLPEILSDSFLWRSLRIVDSE